MLLEMSMKMGSRQMPNDVREIAARRANRQQQRILLQISVVALIFYAYMTAYYISYYVAFMQTTAAMIFNSFFYSTTHMINPVIYFSLNKEMRAQLKQAFHEFRNFIRCRRGADGFVSSNSKAATQREYTSANNNEVPDRAHQSGTTFSETSPLVSANNQYRSTGALGETSVRNECAIDVNDHDESKDTLSKIGQNKLAKKDRSIFIDELVKALQYDSQPQLETATDSGIVCPPRKELKKQSHSLEVPKAVRGRYLRMSSTLQLISKENLDGAIKEMPRKYQSVQNFDRKPLLGKPATDSDEEEETPSTQESTNRSRCSSRSSVSSWKNKQLIPTNRFAFTIHQDEEEHSTDDEEIAYL